MMRYQRVPRSLVLPGTGVKRRIAAALTEKGERDGSDKSAVRARILEAAFAGFVERGYSATSTLEIATRARVSKRDLYALVGTKQEMLAACIGARARRLQAPGALPAPCDRESLGRVLTAFGIRLLSEVSEGTVIAVFRLAIAEAVHAPEVARTLHSLARETSQGALREIMGRALAAGVVDGQAAELAEQFLALLWRNLLIDLLLGVAERPDSGEIARRAGEAAGGFLRLYPRAGGVGGVAG